MLFDTSVIFEENYNSDKFITINQGGTSSGKTYAILQVLIVKCIEKSHTDVLVIGQDIPNLKLGAYKDMKDILSKSEYLISHTSFNESDRIVKFSNGSKIVFTSFQDSQDAKSGKRNYAFFNELNGIKYSIFYEIYLRTTEGIFCDYNPNSKFWVHDKLIGRDDVKLIISDHRHNPFLLESVHKKIESIEDEELFKVYARGLTGQIKGIIYNNWSLCNDMPGDYKFRYIGIDFGFTNDPTAIVDVMISGGEIFIDEICYNTNMHNSDIISILKKYPRIECICDSAEPKTISELKLSGINATPAVKGPDSIRYGIEKIKQYKMNVTRSSINIRKELERYKWKEDKGGTAINIPVDGYNHALDALRYVVQTKMNIKKRSKPIFV